MRKSIKLGLSFVVMSFLVNGCGSSESGGSSNLFTDAKLAPVSVDSGKEISKNIVANKTSTNLGSLNADENKNADEIINAGSNIAILSSSVVRYSKKYIKKTSYALNEAIDDQEKCSNGGTIHYKGSGSESGGSISMTYDNCEEDSGIVMNGSMHMDVKMSNEEYSSMKLTFPSDLTIKEKEKTTKIFKNSKIIMDNMGEPVYDMESTLKLDVDGKLYGSENSKWKIKNASMYQTSGKEYIDNLSSYVTFDSDYDMSKTPFVYSYSGLMSGEAHYIGDNNGKIVLKVVKENEINVKIDSDNDGVFETEEIFNN